MLPAVRGHGRGPRPGRRTRARQRAVQTQQAPRPPPALSEQDARRRKLVLERKKYWDAHVAEAGARVRARDEQRWLAENFNVTRMRTRAPAAPGASAAAAAAAEARPAVAVAPLRYMAQWKFRPFSKQYSDASVDASTFGFTRPRINRQFRRPRSPQPGDVAPTFELYLALPAQAAPFTEKQISKYTKDMAPRAHGRGQQAQDLHAILSR